MFSYDDYDDNDDDDDDDDDNDNDYDDTLLNKGMLIRVSKGKSRLRSKRNGGFLFPHQPV